MAAGTDNWNDVPENMFDVSRKGSLRSNRLRPSSLPQDSQQQPTHDLIDRIPGNPQQPRRKTSQQRQSAVTRQPLSERDLDQSSDSALGGILDLHTAQSFGAEEPYSLQAVADRVGREVEQFAERLDKWKTELEGDDAQKPGYRISHAIDLVQKFKGVAVENVRTLQQRHATTLRNRVKARLAESYQPATAHGNAVRAIDIDAMAIDQSGAGARTTVDDLEYWQHERNTWRLYESLLQVRNQEPTETTLPATEIPLVSDKDRFAADGELWHSYLISNRQAQERVLVLKWLEQSAEKTGDDVSLLEQRLETISRSGHGMWVKGWLNTRESLKQEKRLRAVDRPLDGDTVSIPSRHDASKKLVTQLDPDAPTRLRSSLEAQDELLEEATWLVCWELLRRGRNIDELREWCHEHHDYGKVYMLGAYAASEQGKSKDQAIRARWAWRVACLEAARKGGINDYERAAFGLLAGEGDSVQQICKTWEDHLFSLINQIVVSDYQQYTLLKHPQLVPGPHTYNDTADNRISASLKSGASVSGLLKTLQANVAVGHGQDQHPLQALQSSLISKDLGSLAHSQGCGIARRGKVRGTMPLHELVPSQILESLAEQTPADNMMQGIEALRVLTHVLIIEKHLGLQFNLPEQDEASDIIVISYIEFLIVVGKLLLIPLYVSLLPRNKAPRIMARVLASFPKDDSARKEYAQGVRASKVDLLDALKFQYRTALENSTLSKFEPHSMADPHLLQKTPDPLWPGYCPAAALEGAISSEDEAIVNACHWFKFIDGCWTQTFDVLKDAVLRFLRAGKISAAIDLTFKMVPAKVSRSKTRVMLGRGFDLLERDSLAQDELSDAIEAMRAHAKPYYDIAQLMAVFAACSGYRALTDRRALSNTMNASERGLLEGEITKLLGRAKELTYCYLTDKDFLQHSLQSATGEGVKEMLEVVRDIYVPEALLGYISMLYRSGREEDLRECTDLAKEVAERAELQKCFTATRRMRELVEAIALCNNKLLQLAEKQQRGKKGRVPRRQSVSAGWHK